LLVRVLEGADFEADGVWVGDDWDDGGEVAEFVLGAPAWVGVSGVEVELAEAGWRAVICPPNGDNVIQLALNRNSTARVIAKPR